MNTGITKTFRVAIVVIVVGYLCPIATGCRRPHMGFYRCPIAPFEMNGAEIVAIGEFTVDGALILGIESDDLGFLTSLSENTRVSLEVKSDDSDEVWVYDSVELYNPEPLDSDFFLPIQAWRGWGFFEEADPATIGEHSYTIRIELPVAQAADQQPNLFLTKIEMRSLSMLEWYFAGRPDLKGKFLRCN